MVVLLVTIRIEGIPPNPFFSFFDVINHLIKHRITTICNSIFKSILKALFFKNKDYYTFFRAKTYPNIYKALGR